MSSRAAEKVFVITGATSGIGHALVPVLLSEGAAIIGVGRSRERCLQAEESLRQQFPESTIAYSVANLALQTEVRGLAGQIGEILERWNVRGLDGLINNAGTFSFWKRITPEGFETQWAVNHLAPFLLTAELLPELMLPEKARVITVSSGSHYNTEFNWDDPQLLQRFNPMQAYKQTKLANVWFTLELNRRLGPDSSIRAFAADPGLVNTGMGEKTGFKPAGWYWSYRRRKGIPADESAAGIAALLLNPDADKSGALYWKHGMPKAPDPQALDPVASERLWQISAEMCGLDEERYKPHPDP